MAVETQDEPSNGVDSSLSGKPFDGVVIGGVVGGILLLILTITIYTCCVNKKKRKQVARHQKDMEVQRMSVLTHDYEEGAAYGMYSEKGVALPDPDHSIEVVVPSLNVDVPLPQRQHIRRYSSLYKRNFQPLSHKVPTIESLEASMKCATINESRLKLDDVITRGTFSLIYNGRLKDKSQADVKYQKVTVKTIHGPECTPAVLMQFVEDGLLLHSFVHQNVLSLIGIIIRNDQPFLVFPRADNKVLHQYISDVKKHFTVRTLILMGYQAAEGLKYLSQHGFVHEDVAARNCLVAGDGHVMLGDHALSQDIFEEDYSTVEHLSHLPLPIGWMAVETLTQLNYSLQSDVWSMGIVLWELLTRGQEPYLNMDAHTIIAYVRTGQRLEMPTVAPTNLYNLMLNCWHEDPTARPSISAMCDSLKCILKGPSATDLTSMELNSHL